MHIDDNHISIFNSLPEYGLIINSKGYILHFTEKIKSVCDIQNPIGHRLQNTFPILKRRSITRLDDYEFDFTHKKKNYRFKLVVKPLESKRNETYIVLLKDITNEFRQEKINRLLLSISQLESESESLDQFYRTIQDELNTLFDANNLYIVLFDKFRLSLNLAYLSDTHNIQQLYPKGNTFALWVAKTGKAVKLSQQQIKRLQKKHKLEFYGPQAKCWMGVPLKIKNDVIGVIAVQNYDNIDAFKNEDLDVLKFISTQIATSIQRKENESELLIAKEKAIESDKLKSAFLANMSHEIRTPMNAILGFSELISRPNLQPEKRDTYTHHIVSNGKILLTLVDDIIDLAKIEAGQLKIKRNSSNIDELLSELQHFCISEKKRIKKDEIQIVRQTNRDGNQQWLLCDSFRLKQVLLNLLSNALKFTLNGFIEFGYEIPNNATIQFYVKDTGIGIAENQQKIIFDRFRQADDSVTRQYGGTGLGLSITKKLVELMGGHIWLKSETNVGTTFYFTLPLIIPDLGNKHLEDKSKASNPFISFKSKTVLVVEDNEANYLYLYELINPTGLKIVRAINGKIAVEYIRNNNHVNLILMDMQLPEMDGFEATRLIKEINPKIPIIAQTAYALADERNRALSAGCDYYLSKPITPDALLYLLNQILS